MNPWISSNVPLSFRFHLPAPPQLNRLWLDAMARSSQGIRGMLLIPRTKPKHISMRPGA